MSKRSSVIGISVVLMLTLMVFAFSFSTQAQDAPAPTATPIIGEFGEGGTHVAFWNGLTGSDGVTLNAMLADFVVEHPEISVTTEIVDWNTLYTKLQAAFVAGQPPELILLHASEIPQFASYGVLKDLSGWYDVNGGWFPVDDLAATTYNGMSYKGVTYGIPLDNHGRGLWINVGAFEKAGVDPDAAPPTTYEGWVALFQQLTLDANGNNAASPDFDATNVVQWGFSVEEWARVNFLAAIAQHGGSIVSDDMMTATVNTEAGVAALQEYVDLVSTYHVSPAPAGFNSWQSWAGGTVAVLPSGTWLRNFAADQTDIDYRAWPNVQFGAEPGTWFGAHTFMVPASLEGEKLAAVETLVQWVSENQVAWAASGQVPARLSAQAALDPETYPTNIVLGATFGEYGVLDIQHTAVQELYTALDPELSAALNGQKTAQQALDDANARMQQILDRNPQ